MRRVNCPCCNTTRDPTRDEYCPICQKRFEMRASRTRMTSIDRVQELRFLRDTWNVPNIPFSLKQQRVRELTGQELRSASDFDRFIREAKNNTDIERELEERWDKSGSSSQPSNRSRQALSRTQPNSGNTSSSSGSSRPFYPIDPADAAQAGGFADDDSSNSTGSGGGWANSTPSSSGSGDTGWADDDEEAIPF